MTNQTLFIRVAQVTLALVFLVILAGSVVRASGSGMGCPDWPKCFGTWIPPTDASQLPADYKTRYAGEHNAVEEFNATRTWTEYVNRLLGAILGIAIFIQLIFAFRQRKNDAKLFWMALAMFILVGFQGWLGARVVASNLAPLKITTHMVVALIILAQGLWIVFRLQSRSLSMKFSISPLLLWGSLLLSIVQIMLGTQVRETVDVLLDSLSRPQITNALGTDFITHRFLAWAVLLLNGWIIYHIRQSSASSAIQKVSIWLGAMLLAEIGWGMVLTWFDFPAFAQPLHLLFACFLFSLQIWLLLHQRNTQKSHAFTR